MVYFINKIVLLAGVLFLMASGLGVGQEWGVHNKQQPSNGPAWSDLVRSDPIHILTASLRYYHSHYRDYTCTFTKQERLASGLSKIQIIEVKFRESPFSVAMHWLTNPSGADRALYVEGTNKNRVKVRPTGLSGFLLRSVNLDPDSPRVMRTTLYPITTFGFRRTLEMFLDVERRALAAGDIDPRAPGVYAVETRHPDTGRPSVRLTRRLPDGKGYPSVLTRAWIDKEYRVPTRFEGFDANGQLIFRYVLSNVRFNVGLTDDDFSPRANGFK